jgi:hypothetical protein
MATQEAQTATQTQTPAPGGTRARLELRRARDRGAADHGWLRSHHTFSFADYYDPCWQGFRSLRVINDDRVAPGGGFPTHGHRDMEILSYVLEGALEHKDSMGTGSVIRPGDVQLMSAGTGVRHSEFNASRAEPVHFLQIWIQPKQAGIQPSYAQRMFSNDDKRGRLRVVASPTGADDSLVIHSDARVLAGIFDAAEQTTFHIEPGRHVWLHVAKGEMVVNGERLVAGDAAYSVGDGVGDIVLEGVKGGGEVLPRTLIDGRSRGVFDGHHWPVAPPRGV